MFNILLDNFSIQQKQICLVNLAKKFCIINKIFEKYFLDKTNCLEGIKFWNVLKYLRDIERKLKNAT